MRSVTAISRRPLIIISVLGCLISVVTVAVILYYFLIYLFSGEVPSGFTSLILSLWFLGGLMILSVGIVAMYIAVIFSEVKARPAAIVRDVYRAGQDDVDVKPKAELPNS